VLVVVVVVVVMMMMMMMMMMSRWRRRRNSILTAKNCADRHTTQSSALSVPTVSNNVFNITRQLETEYLKYMQSNIS
jgi:flagellar basal body-associated protein FliL